MKSVSNEVCDQLRDKLHKQKYNRLCEKVNVSVCDTVSIMVSNQVFVQVSNHIWELKKQNKIDYYEISK